MWFAASTQPPDVGTCSRPRTRMRYDPAHDRPGDVDDEPVERRDPVALAPLRTFWLRRSRSLWCSIVSKTLIIAEKPSVGRDLAAALPGTFAKHEGYLESDENVVTWAVGHLVTLAEPEDYDERLKRWRMADLPIVPDAFKLKPRDDKSRKQLKVIHKLLKREDVDRVINACDSGREGELIFAYVYETAKVQKPVERLWISSMTKQAIQEGFGHLRSGEQMEPLEQAARSRSEADWLVGHERDARRVDPAAGRVRRRRVARPRPDADARARRPPRARDPGVRPRAVLARRGRFEATGERAYTGRYLGGKRIGRRRRGRDRRATATAGPARSRSSRRRRRREQPQLLYDLTSLQRHANTLFGFSARRTLRAAQKLYEEHKAITYPRTSSRFLTCELIEEIKPTADARRRERRSTRGPRGTSSASSELPLGRVVNDAKVDDHHAIIPTDVRARRRADEARTSGGSSTSSPSASSPSSTRRPCSSGRGRDDGREHVFRTSGRVLLEAGWKAVYGEEPAAPRPRTTTRAATSRCRRSSEGEAVETRAGRGAAQGDAAAAALHRRVAARGDGDGREGHRGRASSRGDEGLAASERPPRGLRSSSASSTSGTSSATAGRCTRPRRASRSSRCSASTRSPRRS